MAKQRSIVSHRQNGRFRSRNGREARNKHSDGQMALAELTSEPIGSLANLSLHSKAERIGDGRFSLVQRQAMAAQLAGTVGNRRLLRVIASMDGRASGNGIMRAGPTWGSEKTTSPVARSRPQSEMVEELKNEVKLFEFGKIVIDWVESKKITKPGKSGGASKAGLFTAAELFADKKTIRKMSPRPKSADDLKPALDLLVHYGVVTQFDLPIMVAPLVFLNMTFYDIPLDAKTGLMNTAKFATAQKDVTKFTTEFEKRVGRKDPVRSTVETDLLPLGLSAGRKTKEIKDETAAESALADARAQLNEFIIILKPSGKGKARKAITRALTPLVVPVPAKKGGGTVFQVVVANKKKPVLFTDPIDTIEHVGSGTHPETQELRKKIETNIEKAELKLKSARRYRTFAKVNVDFMNELGKRNSNWRAGNYAGHSWGEFSIDIFIRSSVVRGFYEQSVVTKFFEDVNAVAEAGVGDVKKFAWRALYNDMPLGQALNRRFGSKRLIWTVPHHGPHPDKLHIHMDLRPVDVKKDAETGYKVEGGRIKLL